MYVTQLKKEYNYMVNGFRQYMANEGVMKLSDTTLWSKLTTSGLSASNLQNNPEAKEEFLKIFNVMQIYDNNNKMPGSNDSGGLVYNYFNNKQFQSGPVGYYMNGAVCLADGACFDLYLRDSVWTASCGDHTCSSLKEFQKVKNTPTKLWQLVGYNIYLDVNGPQKGPNQMGRDFFVFELGNDGNLYPYGGADYAVFHGDTYAQLPNTSNNYYWKNGNNQWCDPKSDISYNIGASCAARIMEEGWKMNY